MFVIGSGIIIPFEVFVENYDGEDEPETIIDKHVLVDDNFIYIIVNDRTVFVTSDGNFKAINEIETTKIPNFTIDEKIKITFGSEPETHAIFVKSIDEWKPVKNYFDDLRQALEGAMKEIVGDFIEEETSDEEDYEFDQNALVDMDEESGEENE